MEIMISSCKLAKHIPDIAHANTFPNRDGIELVEPITEQHVDEKLCYLIF
jgi:hypothetical protein